MEMKEEQSQLTMFNSGRRSFLDSRGSSQGIEKNRRAYFI
jgi:hypothetical protein